MAEASAAPAQPHHVGVEELCACPSWVPPRVCELQVPMCEFRVKCALLGRWLCMNLHTTFTTWKFEFGLGFLTGGLMWLASWIWFHRLCARDAEPFVLAPDAPGTPLATDEERARLPTPLPFVARCYTALLYKGANPKMLAIRDRQGASLHAGLCSIALVAHVLFTLVPFAIIRMWVYTSHCTGEGLLCWTAEGMPHGSKWIIALAGLTVLEMGVMRLVARWNVQSQRQLTLHHYDGAAAVAAVRRKAALTRPDSAGPASPARTFGSPGSSEPSTPAGMRVAGVGDSAGSEVAEAHSPALAADQAVSTAVQQPLSTGMKQRRPAAAAVAGSPGGTSSPGAGSSAAAQGEGKGCGGEHKGKGVPTRAGPVVVGSGGGGIDLEAFLAGHALLVTETPTRIEDTAERQRQQLGGSLTNPYLRDIRERPATKIEVQFLPGAALLAWGACLRFLRHVAPWLPHLYAKLPTNQMWLRVWSWMGNHEAAAEVAFQRHGKQETTLKSLQQRLSCFDGVCIIPVKVTKTLDAAQADVAALQAKVDCLKRQLQASSSAIAAAAVGSPTLVGAEEGRAVQVAPRGPAPAAAGCSAAAKAAGSPAEELRRMELKLEAAKAVQRAAQKSSPLYDESVNKYIATFQGMDVRREAERLGPPPGLVYHPAPEPSNLLIGPLQQRTARLRLQRRSLQVFVLVLIVIPWVLFYSLQAHWLMLMCGAGGMAVVQVAYGSPASLAFFINGTVQVVQAAAPAPDSWLCTTQQGWWAQLGVVTIAGMAAQLLFLLGVEWLIEKATEAGGTWVDVVEQQAELQRRLFYFTSVPLLAAAFSQGSWFYLWPLVGSNNLEVIALLPGIAVLSSGNYLLGFLLLDLTLGAVLHTFGAAGFWWWLGRMCRYGRMTDAEKHMPAVYPLAERLGANMGRIMLVGLLMAGTHPLAVLLAAGACWLLLAGQIYIIPRACQRGHELGAVPFAVCLDAMHWCLLARLAAEAVAAVAKGRHQSLFLLAIAAWVLRDLGRSLQQPIADIVGARAAGAEDAHHLGLRLPPAVLAHGLRAYQHESAGTDEQPCGPQALQLTTRLFNENEGGWQL